MLRRLLSVFKRQLSAEAAADAYVQSQTGGDPEIAVIVLDMMVQEAEEGKRQGKGVLTVNEEYLNAFIRLAKKSTRPILNPKVKALVMGADS